MSGGQEQVVPERLVRLANDLDDRVGPSLDLARAWFAQAQVDGGAFSQAGLAMQFVHPGVRAWAEADAADARTELRSLTDRVARTATTWADAERDSTVVET